MERYIKTLKNRDLNDFFTRNIGFNQLSSAIINSQQQTIVSLFKNMMFPKKLLHR